MAIMAEIRTVTTLTKKRDEIARSIIGYERHLAQAKADLSHVNATLAIFAGAGAPGDHKVYVDIDRVFRYGEIALLGLAALTEGQLSTPDITKRIMVTKGLDVGDRVLAKQIGMSVVHSFRGLHRRGKVRLAEKRRNICVWKLA